MAGVQNLIYVRLGHLSQESKHFNTSNQQVARAGSFWTGEVKVKPTAELLYSVEM